MVARIHIGTSGWHYKHWLGVFYPPGLKSAEMLEFYAQSFDTVEINNTFYHLVANKTFDNWRDLMPAHFRFAIKASRFITHMKKLKDARTSSAKFFSGAERLGKKLGPILFQLPPRWHMDLDRLTSFLRSLPAHNKYVFEFRDPSWLNPYVYEALRAHNAAFCIHDLANMETPLEITANFTYVRFHGPTTIRYAGSYSTKQLRRWADWLEEKRSELAEIYAYFNNDPAGAAIRNALTFKNFLGDN